MMEGIMQVASGAETCRPPTAVGPRDAALRAARTCYDHMAGRLGVALADAMVTGGYAELTKDAGVITEAGLTMLACVGLDVDALATTNGKRWARVLCRPCLDWSERRPHLAGTVGASICKHMVCKSWLRRIEGTRGFTITPKGRQVFQDTFGVRLG